MHIDEGKKFDKRNLEGNIKSGSITRKEYEAYLSRLPEADGMIFNPEAEEPESSDETELTKKKAKKKAPGKGK
jgi:hypothetical protein